MVSNCCDEIAFQALDRYEMNSEGGVTIDSNDLVYLHDDLDEGTVSFELDEGVDSRKDCKVFDENAEEKGGIPDEILDLEMDRVQTPKGNM